MCNTGMNEGGFFLLIGLKEKIAGIQMWGQNCMYQLWKHSSDIDIFTPPQSSTAENMPLSISIAGYAT